MDANETTPKRVLVVVSRRSPHWDKAWTSSQELVPVALRILQTKQLVSTDAQHNPEAVRLLATERWDLRTYIVFDIFHKDYDPDTAHLPKKEKDNNDLPVVAVFLGQKETATVAGQPMANKVHSDIRALHNATGLGSRPPFFVDHANGKVPFYGSPRTSLYQPV